MIAFLHSPHSPLPPPTPEEFSSSGLIEDTILTAAETLQAWRCLSPEETARPSSRTRKLAWSMVASWGRLRRAAPSLIASIERGPALLTVLDTLMESDQGKPCVRMAASLVDIEEWKRAATDFILREADSDDVDGTTPITLLRSLDDGELVAWALENQDEDRAWEIQAQITSCTPLLDQEIPCWLGASDWIRATLQSVDPDIEKRDPTLAGTLFKFEPVMEHTARFYAGLHDPGPEPPTPLDTRRILRAIHRLPTPLHDPAFLEVAQRNHRGKLLEWQSLDGWGASLFIYPDRPDKSASQVELRLLNPPSSAVSVLFFGLQRTLLWRPPGEPAPLVFSLDEIRQAWDFDGDELLLEDKDGVCCGAERTTESLCG